MPSYEVVKACYVPFGRGVRYRTPGQVVTLDANEAESLDGYVRPTEENVRKPDTTVIVRIPDSAPTVRKPDTSATIRQEVIHDGGDSGSGDE